MFYFDFVEHRPSEAECKLQQFRLATALITLYVGVVASL